MKINPDEAGESTCDVYSIPLSGVCSVHGEIEESFHADFRCSDGVWRSIYCCNMCLMERFQTFVDTFPPYELKRKNNGTTTTVD